MSFEKLSKDFLSIDYNIMRPKGFINRINNRAEGRVISVKEKKGFIDINFCPICSSKDNSFEFEKFGVKILKCNSCTVRYVEKMPIDILDVYSSEKFETEINSNILTDEQDNYKKERFGKERANLINSCLENKNTPSILDVGCGSGWFLDLMKNNGMDVYGIEIVKPLNNLASKKLGVEIYNKLLEDSPENKYDVITMFDLIEHVKDPAKLLEETKKRLKPGGIAVVFTPNFDSLAISTMREVSTLVTPVEHLYYFTKNSIEVLAKRVGLSVCFFETKGTDILDMKAFYEYHNRDKEANLLVEIGDNLQCIIDASNCANHMRIIFKNE